MNRILDLLRGRLPPPAEPTDRHLLDRFVAERDEAAFAELVRRHGGVVWGVCRRLVSYHDAEDAFQATFLVLVRRANHLAADVPLGPWLHRVAVMTARNVIRGNRRRAAVTGPMEHDVPAACGVADHLDLDAAILALPERYRVPVVLCHLQGLSRREAASQLGCPEGTLSARLSRALARLRARLGAPAILATATVAVPASLSAATVRVAVIYSTSTLSTAGVSPTVTGLTDGVLRMFWMKKLTAGLAVGVLVAGGLFAGLAGRSGSIAREPDPPAVPLASEPQPPPQDPAAEKKRLEQQRAELEKAMADIRRRADETNAALAKFDRLFLDKQAANELGNDLAIVVTEGGRGVGWSKPPYTVREVVNGKVGEMQCYELDILQTYLARAFNDPKGPKKLRVYADQSWSHDQVYKLLAVCATAGYQKAVFILPEAPLIASGVDWKTGKAEKVEYGQKEKEIDLKSYLPKKP